jgi:hypothetical protein
MTNSRRDRRAVSVAVGIAIAATIAAQAHGQVESQRDADPLIGIWAQQMTFRPALQGELTVRREGGRWRTTIAGAEAPCQLASNRLRCIFPEARGEFRGALSGKAPEIAGWWLRPSGGTEDRRDPGGSGQPFTTLASLKAAGRDVWRGTVEPLPDRFTLYLRIFRNAGELEGVEAGELVAVFRNPELNSIGGSSYFNVTREGRAVRLLRKVPDGTEIRYDATLEGPPERLKIFWPDVGSTLELARRTSDEAAGFFPRPPGEQK